jgi:hypothetical protein
VRRSGFDRCGSHAASLAIGVFWPTPYAYPPFLPIVRNMTPKSSDALSANSLEQVLQAETENRAWSKTLRQRATALMNSRLAKAISFEEYTLFRQQANKDAVECKQNGRILDDEIRRRDGRYVLRSSLV